MKKNIVLSALLCLIALSAIGVNGFLGSPPASAATESSFVSRRLSDQGVHVPVGASIATTSTTDTYFQVPRSGTLLSIKFSSLAALAASDTNYITWSATNLGQAGAGSTALLAATAVNTTQATGGSAITANSSRSLTLSTTTANLAVTEGDVVRIRATATGTLVGAVTVPSYNVLIRANGS
jgi:hypothetical protein